MTKATRYFIPKEPGRWRALTLAAVMHMVLFSFLWVGIRWQNETPATIEAEVWDPQMKEAAPLLQPEPPPVPQPVEKPEPEPVKVEPPAIKPDIALEQEKKRKEKLQKEHEEAERIEREKEKEKERAEALARKKQEEQAKKEAENKRKQELAEQAESDRRHAENLKRMQTLAGSGGAGDAAKTQGNRGDASYVQKVGAKIRSNTIFNVPEGLVGNPPVEYAVELLPDGSIRRPIRKIKSSGVPGFDEAVLNAIEKSQPYPRDKSGKVPSGFNLIHKPKES
ncbi:MAG TPA: cell envelope integrity protein TolA [Burkholderiaceae bacterium]|jgi:colicin import membrane protein|nr:cell envelope integrity protein TolA [Burkholderiaceae bacterium]